MNSLISYEQECELRTKYGFAHLLQRVGGIIEDVVRLRQEAGSPQFIIGASSLGNLTMTLPNVTNGSGRLRFEAAIGGGAADKHAEVAWVKSLAEGLERYCSFVLTQDDVVVASQDDLGDLALDLRTIPRMSAREYDSPKCPLRPADPSLPIRWVKGLSLTHNTLRYVPAVMSHIFSNPTPAERFWNEISTGVAAHTNFATALVSALCEAVERDAIAMTWLARLPLPRIEIDDDAAFPELAQNLAIARASNLQHVFFDATTDVGIPTVYSVQLLDGHPSLAQSVACATAARFDSACAKTIREATPVRTALGTRPEIPERVEDFVELHHGAIYLGQPECRSAFDFLLNCHKRVKLSALENPFEADQPAQARAIVRRLHERGMEAILVDLTTQELRSAGLWVLRVIVPGLMPMSCIHAARYLGHPRLYDYHERLGYGPLSEDDINPLPQPFA